MPGSLTGTLIQHLHSQHDLQPPPNCGPNYNIPVEILLEIFGFLTPSHVQEGMHTLLTLTHVCQSWRDMLINKPQAWTTIFATQQDCQSMVKMCLKRSYPASLEVAVEVGCYALAHPSCTCSRNSELTLVPNEIEPYEWHFVFESLAEPEHSKHIHTLNILCHDNFSAFPMEAISLESCQIFRVPYLQLTSLNWKDELNKPWFCTPSLTLLPCIAFPVLWRGCWA